MCLDWKDNQDKQQQYKILSLCVCYFFFLIKFLSPLDFTLVLEMNEIDTSTRGFGCIQSCLNTVSRCCLLCLFNFVISVSNDFFLFFS